MSLDVAALRAQFPILSKTVDGKPLVYLDNAATTQKPQAVIDALVDFYTGTNANVHRGAHHLSDVINTKPELEIYADDVKCAHGATVAEIEEEALYYMLTRGIARSKALVMLNFGFIQELINDVPNGAIREWLAPLLSERFAQMEVK